MLKHAADFNDDARKFEEGDAVDISSAASRRSAIHALGDADWQQRRLAVERLRSAVAHVAASADSRDQLLAALFDALADTENAGRRAGALAAIESFGESSLESIAAYLKTASVPARIALAGGIGTIGGTRAVRLLASLMNDNDPNVATAAVAALGRTASTEAATLLLNRLADDDFAEDLWLRFAAVTALGELGDERACARLEELLDDEDLRETACHALAEIASPRSLQTLLEHLPHADGADGTLNFETLEAVVALTEEERSLPRALVEHLRLTAQTAVRALLDDSAHGKQIFDELLGGANEHNGRTNNAQCALVALGWSGRTEAFATIARALGEPALGRTARHALARLVQSEDVLAWLFRHRAVLFRREALEVITEAATREAKGVEANEIETSAGETLAEAHIHLAPVRAVLPLEIATALFGVRSLRAIALCAHLSVEATDDETHAAATAALTDADEWLEEYLASVPESHGELLNLSKELLEHIRERGDQGTIEIAAVAGRLTRHLAGKLNSVNHPDAIAVSDVAASLLRVLPTAQAGTDAELARLTFLEDADAHQAAKAALRAQHHPHMRVRLRALKILEKHFTDIDLSQFAQHLTDEEPGVRRAALRALRNTFRAQGANDDKRMSDASDSSTASVPAPASRRDLRGAVAAALADDHIWVRLEAVATYGTMFAKDAAARAELRRLLSDGHPLTRVSATRTLASVSDDAEDWQSLAELAERDAQAEVRRAATQVFAICPDAQIRQNVLSRSLADAEWSVRRAAATTLGAVDNVSEANTDALVLVARNPDETATVRGAACKSLAEHNYTEILSIACALLATRDLTVVEDAYAALLKLRTHGDRGTEFASLRKSLAEIPEAPPRAIMIANFALA